MHYNDNDIIRIYVLDAEGKANLPIRADEVTIKRTAGKEVVSFTLEPEDANEQGEAAAYMLEDKELTIAISLGVEVEIKVGDEVHRGKIPPHEPHHH